MKPNFTALYIVLALFLIGSGFFLYFEAGKNLANLNAERKKKAESSYFYSFDDYSVRIQGDDKNAKIEVLPHE